MRSGKRQFESRQYRNMKLRIQYMYEKGETNYLDLLFKSADLTQLFNRGNILAVLRHMIEKCWRVMHGPESRL